MKGYRSIIEKLIISSEIEISKEKVPDLIIHDDRFYRRVLRDGSLGLGETYMEGWWDSAVLDQVLYKLLCANLEGRMRNRMMFALQTVKSKLFNQQSILEAHEVTKRHYDLGNDLFECMLDKYMLYSCAYWDKAKTLEEAQEHKLELICRKLMLSPGQTVLDIGCGWGGFAYYAAKKYNVNVLGITISPEQAVFAKRRCTGLPVSIKLLDYRELNGCFDRVVSIGMFEHVGYKNYAAFMEAVQHCLKSDGIFLLHSIGGNESTVRTDAWINRYIFPNGMMPSVKQIGEAIEKRFIIQDWHNFGLHYDKTLMEWLKNFKNSWPILCNKYDEKFYRMWEYYLCLSAASFRARNNQLWQVVLTPYKYPGEYRSIR